MTDTEFLSQMALTEESLRVIRLIAMTPWWIGRSGTCSHCSTMIEIANKQIGWHKSFRLTSPNVIHVTCPGCESLIEITR